MKGDDVTASEPRFGFDVLELLTMDHRAVERLFAEIEAQPVDHRRKNLFNELTQELAAHTDAEERILHPTIRSEVVGGERLVEDATTEHQAIEDGLARLGRLDPNDHEAELLFRRLVRDIRSHVEEEEGALFPKLRAAVSRDRLIEMAEQVSAARLAPARVGG